MSSIIRGAVSLLGSTVDLVSGASAVSSKLSTQGGYFKFVIFMPARGYCFVLFIQCTTLQTIIYIVLIV